MSDAGDSAAPNDRPRAEAASLLRLHTGSPDELVEPALAPGEEPSGESAPHPRQKKIKRPLQHRSREHRRRRMRRRGRRAYIRSVYFLPSLATLGNAICGFAAIYVSAFDPEYDRSRDAVTSYLIRHHFVAAAYLIFFAMIFDAIDGRLARYTRHTTDFGGQLDSLADVVSFGVAPAFLALELFKSMHANDLIPPMSRLIWAVGALYMSCATMRLARFNVSNEHGEQAHFSFLGLPSPGAGAAVAGWVLFQQELASDPWHGHLAPLARALSNACIWLLPVIVLVMGLLMISSFRYGHMINRYLRGKRSIERLILVVGLILLFLIAHRYVIAIGALGYALAGPVGYLYARLRRRHIPAPPLH